MRRQIGGAMPDRRRRIAVQEPPLTASATQISMSANEPVASARDLQPQYESWQDEAWSFFENLGEFNYGVTWRANALSRVRLLAAEVTPGGDEPAPLEDENHPAVKLIAELGGDTAGQSMLMKAFGIHLQVPGESWLVGRDLVEGVREWKVYSADTIRRSRRKGVRWDIQTSDTKWESLEPDSAALRIWEPNQRYAFRADSAAKAALPIMREIDLYNRHIIATLVSRLAMNGFLLIPSEVSFPVKPQFENAADPFVAELIDIASKAIKNPGSASAAIPIPIRAAAEFIDKFKHLIVANGIDPKILEARDKAIIRLATSLHMPAEVLTGMGDVNHWSAWQLEEGAIKVSISPLAEVIVGGLTVAYLRPALESIGEPLIGPNGGAIVVWYDTSELVNRPDRAREAIELYDRLELSGEALRREVGLDEADKPEGQDLKDQILKWAVQQVQLAPSVWQELAGLDLEIKATPGAAGAPPGGTTPQQNGRGRTPPTSRSATPALPDRSPPQRASPSSNGRDQRTAAQFAELFGKP